MNKVMDEQMRLLIAGFVRRGNLPMDDDSIYSYLMYLIERFGQRMWSDLATRQINVEKLGGQVQ